MSSLGTTIKDLREERQWTQAELAHRINATKPKLETVFDQTTVSRIETNQRRVPPNERKAIARAFEMELGALDDKWRASNVERSKVANGIPVINRAPAGMVLNYEEYGMDSGHGFEYLDHGDINDDLAFAVIVVGESMEPGLMAGDHVILTPLTIPKPQAKLEDGKVVFVRFTPESNRDGCMLARYRSMGEGVAMLYKDNPAFPPTMVKRQEIEQLSVAIEKRSKKV